jgi:hypothetical protein
VPEGAISGQAARYPEPVATETIIPVYDPHYDVVGKLPKAIIDEPCEAGLLRGFGNRYKDAAKAYYDRNIASFRATGRSWREFGLGCRVFDCEDDHGHGYFMAIATAGNWNERLLSYEDWLQANNLDFGQTGNSVGEGLASAHGARAFCPPSNTEHAHVFNNNVDALPLGDRLLAYQTRAECPRSVASREATTLHPSPLTLHPSPRPPPDPSFSAA